MVIYTLTLSKNFGLGVYFYHIHEKYRMHHNNNNMMSVRKTLYY